MWRDLLTAYDGTAITYDAIGNPLSYRGMTFTWQNGRELTTAVKNGVTANYVYNTDGGRYTKTVGGVVTQYYYVDGTLYAERTGNNTIVYLYDDKGTPYAFTLNGTKYYYEYNLQGDVIGLFDGNGDRVVRYYYTPYGALQSMVDNTSNGVGTINPLRYRGYYYDTETGFYYCGSRYYDPEIGRWINADKYVSTGTGMLGYNMFAYCNNNPVMYVDPEGCSIIGAIGIGLITLGIALFCTSSNTSIVYSKSNRKPGKTPPSSWPPLPDNLGGKSPSWNPNGYWEGKEGDLTWDNRSHGAGVDRGNGPQDGHWDDENSNRRWDKAGNPLGEKTNSFSPSYSFNVPTTELFQVTIVTVVAYTVLNLVWMCSTGTPSPFQASLG